MKYDVVLFDLDGTLTRSGPGITNSVQYALERLGRPRLPDDVLCAFIGPPLFESFCELGGLDEEDAHRAIAHYRERFDRVGWMENSVYRGIPGLLRALRAGGAYIAVATAKPQVYAERIIAHFGLSGFFDRIEGISLSDHHADKAALIERATRGQTGRAVMVGDRASDMRGARATGVDSIGVLYGYGSEGELTQAGAQRIAGSVEDLSELLLDGAQRAPGFFITFEGLDGCGKTTQLDGAAEYLEHCGYEVVRTREPGGCPISEKIRALILDVESQGMTPLCEALLFAAARAQHVTEVIRPAIERSAVVLCDRFLDSSVAYQGFGRKLGARQILEINRPAVQEIMPDRTLFFDATPDLAAFRRNNAGELDRMELEGEIFNQRVYHGFRSILDAEPGRVVCVDATIPISDVGARVRDLLRTLIER